MVDVTLIAEIKEFFGKTRDLIIILFVATCFAYFTVPMINFLNARESTPPNNLLYERCYPLFVALSKRINDDMPKKADFPENYLYALKVYTKKIQKITETLDQQYSIQKKFYYIQPPFIKSVFEGAATFCVIFRIFLCLFKQFRKITYVDYFVFSYILTLGIFELYDSLMFDAKNCNSKIDKLLGSPFE